ncbi:phenylacetate-CoA oxygenase subunit PaaI [Neobacillus piezotolerans]|uniref:Phenylacetate-CoA oxygenase subunit PaaI n=1 Tax=Neobacillus piezotolerans TaxID=2259171 RepID=A0A3D8GNN6_9BACI|nr:1,2-phenylacetyl-CoA epoxidase subunit PaaC [Neobacillus piezotolerans]RDU35789.1 phenylacetate-CoA oxygenase subunit PaaI [Neobacillus piezotolerans]
MAAELPGYREALAELLYQLADDDFIVAYRGSEWLGLAPHIEEDVAFSSISQDTMGHAAIFYKLLEELGEGNLDDLAHGRPARDRKNAILLELANGTGTYLNEPRYDWAFAVVRHYFYTVAKRIKMASLMRSSYIPLAEAAARVNVELYYHQLHWKTWFTQLMGAGGEAGQRMEAAMAKVFAGFGDVLSQGSRETEFTHHGLIQGSKEITEQWIEGMAPVFSQLGASLPSEFGISENSGRNGDHTQDLEDALSILSEVYRFDPAAGW